MRKLACLLLVFMLLPLACFGESVADRYIELYEHITGRKFEPGDTTDLTARISANVSACLATL